MRILRLGIAVLLLTVLLQGNAYARLGIITPYVQKGKHELLTDGYYTLGAASGDIRQRVTYGVGMTDRLQFFGRAVMEEDDSSRGLLRQTELGGKYELTEKGVWPLDMGIYASALFNYDAPHSRGYQLRLLMGKELGRMSYTSNLMLTNNFGNSWDDGAVELRWRGMYTLAEGSPYAVGLEYFGKFGSAGHMVVSRAQEHLAGPGLVYRFSNAASGELGVLFGVSDAAPDAMLKWRLSFSF